MVKIFFILLFIFSNALASEQQLYVGCSEVSITPNEPVALEGSFTLRISDGIHSPIQASVLAIGTGSKSLKDLSIIVSADLVHIPNVITNKLMMAKYIRGNLDPAVIRIKLEGTRKYLP